MDAGAGEASHRFVIVILIRCNLDAVLHALVGDRAGEEYVFHSVLIIRPCGPARSTGALMIQRQSNHRRSDVGTPDFYLGADLGAPGPAGPSPGPTILRRRKEAARVAASWLAENSTSLSRSQHGQSSREQLRPTLQPNASCGITAGEV